MGLFDPDARLPSGMRATEAVSRASAWWNEYRGAIRQTFNTEQTAPAVRGAIRNSQGVSAPAMIVKGDITDTIQDGILSGKPWADLTLEEQAKIVRVWHHNHVVVPEMEGEKAKLLDMHRVGHGSLVGSEKSETPHEGKPESKPKCSSDDNS